MTNFQKFVASFWVASVLSALICPPVDVLHPDGLNRPHKFYRHCSSAERVLFGVRSNLDKEFVHLERHQPNNPALVITLVAYTAVAGAVFAMARKKVVKQ